ncbi:MAG: CTP synthase [Bacillota bacterium]|nr:CTP synthase [Bacillota bacterium]
MAGPELLASLAGASQDHEFYTPIPQGYTPGRTKYLVVTGSVISGLGKGIFASSLGSLLQARGLVVAPVKFDGYLNQDAGTLNPYRHGEVFVLDDGTECDMDLGSYERFLDRDLSALNYLTGGRVFAQVLQRERHGDYLGRDVQFIPHVTGEIKSFLRKLAISSGADLVVVEVGGTVGDIENGYFLEAMRELQYEEDGRNVMFANVTYVLRPRALGEQKSKAAQLGIRTLMALGIQPAIIACRADEPVSESVREKISIYSNVPVSRVVGLPDTESIYRVPVILHEAGLDEETIDLLGLRDRINAAAARGKQNDLVAFWEDFANRITGPRRELRVAITGKYTEVRDSYASIINALEHAGAGLGVRVSLRWVETTEIGGPDGAAKALEGVHGIIVPGGFGSRGIEGKIACVGYARTHKVPFLGLCLGFQVAVIEYARNCCNLPGAHSTEFALDAVHKVVDLLPEQKKLEGLGGNMRLGGRWVDIKPGTKAHELYGRERVRERFRHRYEANPEYIELVERAGLVFSGKAPDHPIMQILELPGHPFFVGTQFHPELISRPARPHPLFHSFVRACRDREGA